MVAFDAKLERLAALMTEIMGQQSGVGLAATQLGVLSRVIVWEDPDAEGEDPLVYVNPEIEERSESCTTEVEGCLSVPGTSVEVERADEIVVKAQGLSGEPVVVRLKGFPARIVQHEVDHLDGRLILDRATPEERRRALKELRERAIAAES